MTAPSASSPARGADRWWTLVAPAYDRSVALVGWHRWQDALVADVARGPCSMSVVVLRTWRGACWRAESTTGAGPEPRHGDQGRPSRRCVGTRSGPDRPRRRHRHAVPAGSFDVVVATGVLGLLAVPVRASPCARWRGCRAARSGCWSPSSGPTPSRAVSSRIIALVRDRPLGLDELWRSDSSRRC